jgi:toxin-antitoxin system PIN domain toxin
VIAPDANLLIYAYDPASPFHRESRAWMGGLLSSPEPVGVPLYCVQAFLRFFTNPRIAPNPLTFAQAAEIVNSWLELPHVRILYPGDRHWLLLQQLAQQVRLSGPQITDAAIAAIAIEYGAVVHSNDRDFARFRGLRWTNPLEYA